MASKLLRRSGIAVGLVADLLRWRPDAIYQVGVGRYHQELDVLTEEWPGVRIVAYEANPEVFCDVAPGFPGEIKRVAVGAFPHDALLCHPRRHADGSSLHRPFGPYFEHEVRVETLDRLHPDGPAGERNLLWLDCEGGELDVLRGAERFLPGVEMVNVEMTANPPGLGWCDTVEVHDRLEAAGYWLQWTHTNRSSSGQYDAIYVRESLFNPRYCSCPHTIKRWRLRSL